MTDPITRNPFVWTALAWTLLGTGFVAYTEGDWARATGPFLGLALLSALDLLALAKVVERVLGFAAATSEKRGPALVQTFFWGALKLACLGIFILVLSKGVRFAASSLILGLGTLVVVPLVGGYFWSRRDLEHAR